MGIEDRRQMKEDREQMTEIRELDDKSDMCAKLSKLNISMSIEATAYRRLLLSLQSVYCVLSSVIFPLISEF